MAIAKQLHVLEYQSIPVVKQSYVLNPQSIVLNFQSMPFAAQLHVLNS